MEFKYCKLEIFLPPTHLEVDVIRISEPTVRSAANRS